MRCPSCGERKARRACPALGQVICAVCCGTKRLAEIRCPSSCGYLTSARVHPPAVVLKQRQHDIELLAPALRGLTERQSQLLFVLVKFVADYKLDGWHRLLDEDVAEAAGTLAATFETALRGVIYEHHASTLPAQRLAIDLKTTLAGAGREIGAAIEQDAGIVLRRIEQGARKTGEIAGAGPTAYLELLGRLLQHTVDAFGAERSTAQVAHTADPEPLIVL